MQKFVSIYNYITKKKRLCFYLIDQIKCCQIGFLVVAVVIGGTNLCLINIGTTKVPKTLHNIQTWCKLIGKPLNMLGKEGHQ